MADILIRNIAESDVRRLDEKAAALGISRTEYLRRRISEDVSRPIVSKPLQVEDFTKFAELADGELMAAAWQ